MNEREPGASGLRNDYLSRLAKLHRPQHPASAEVGSGERDEIIQWCADMGFFPRDSERAQLARHIDIPLWTALCLPEVSPSGRALINRWWAWGMVWEMLFDSYGEDSFDGFLQETGNALHACLAGETPAGNTSPFIGRLDEMFKEIEQKHGKAWRSRLSENLLGSFHGDLTEKFSSHRHAIPSFEVYCAQRVYTYGQWYVTEIAAMEMGLDPCAKFWQHPIVKKANELTMLHGGLVNDLCSLDRDLLLGKTHNGVLIKQEEGLGIQDAVLEVVGLCNRAVRTVLEMESMMLSYSGSVLGVQETEQVAALFGTLRTLMRGTIDWYHQSPRYTAWQPGEFSDDAPFPSSR
ncbi:hypothetical protein [Streptomyces sp. NPDC051546]|uniref:terpene synthase family protein n=1 Tax=Streptomyces sp. NPDC051546 TaxID=3365655 RepID=UPI0037B0D7DF